MTKKTKLITAVVAIFTTVVAMPIVISFAATSIGHANAEKEYQTIISKLSIMFPSTQTLDCTTKKSNTSGLGLWFEQTRSMECTYSAERGQCERAKEQIKSVVSGMGFSTEPYGRGDSLYLVRTDKSVGTISDLVCADSSENDGSPAGTGRVSFSLQQK